MAERRKAKQKRKEEGLDKPTKEEYAVAKYLRFNLPPKEGKLVGMTVQYFVASKAVDMLMDSQWSTAKAKVDPLFTTRASCVDYMHNLLEKGLFHRAARVEKKKDRDKKKRKGIKDSEVDESGKEEDKKKKKIKKGKEKTKEEEKKEEEKKEEKPKEEKPKEEKEEEKENKKDEERKEEEKKKSKKDKKVRLEMHDLQIFKDGDTEYYVWIYDPVPVKTFIIGLLLVLGAIAVCLFPLWPPEVRLGVYYLSLAAAGFVGVILALCVIRLVLFCIVWGVTFGKHHFWFLPNLTEDVGFFDSFKPLYKHDVMEANKEETDEKDKKKKDEKASIKDKKGPDGKEEKDEERSEDEEKDESGSEAEADVEMDAENDNGENGYEVIEKDELEDEDDRVEDVDDEENSEDSQETKKDK